MAWTGGWIDGWTIELRDGYGQSNLEREYGDQFIRPMDGNNDNILPQCRTMAAIWKINDSLQTSQISI